MNTELCNAILSSKAVSMVGGAVGVSATKKLQWFIFIIHY